MEIDPHLRQLQEQAKMFSIYNSVPGQENEPEQVAPEKEPREYNLRNVKEILFYSNQFSSKCS